MINKLRILKHYLKNHRLFNSINRKKIQLGRILLKRFNNTIKYGHLKGIKLLSGIWHKEDLSSVLIGFYEKEIIDDIFNLNKKFETFINIGAGDGLYATGIAKKNIAKKVIAFEMSKKQQKLIIKISKLNNVHKKISVQGYLDKEKLKTILRLNNKNLILIDIEGNEFDLLTTEILQLMKKSVIYVELHDKYFKNGKILKNKLIKNASNLYDISIIKQMGRNPFELAKLNGLTNDQMWLACSEGRGFNMEWLKLIPKKY